MNDRHHISQKFGRNSDSLFERIQADDQEIHLGGSPDILSAKLRSIKKNLVNVLNSRSGGASSAPLYGLGDLNDANVGSSDMLRQIANQITKAIQLYEPRVENVRVHFERSGNDELELMFHISAQTRIEHKNEHLTIDLVLMGNRGFEIR